MSKKIKKSARKFGLPPGTLVYTGTKAKEASLVKLIAYDETTLVKKDLLTIDENLLHTTAKVHWLNIEGVQDSELISHIGKLFNVDLLVLERIMNTSQRPKFEAYKDFTYVVVKMLDYDDQTDDIVDEQVSIILTPQYVISFQDGRTGDIFDPIRAQIANEKGRIRRMGTDYLLYSLIDIIIDNYFAILEKIGDRIENLEDAIIEHPKPEIVTSINKLKREMIQLRKSVWPLREVIGNIERGGVELIKPETEMYFRDLYDHSVQVIDTIETYRDLLSGMLDIYLTSINNRMNEIMKVLTIIATIFMPLSFIVGLYGMNFKHMPELEWPWAYPAVLILMAGISVLMLVFFKKKRWI